MDKQKLISQLELEEGCLIRLYNDTQGIPTIGIGRNLRDTGVSKEEAYYLCSNDIDRIVNALQSDIPQFNSLDDVRQRVLVDIAFNVGVSGLLLFKNMLSAISVGNWQDAHDQLLNSLAARQAPNRYNRLAQMLLTGQDAV